MHNIFLLVVSLTTEGSNSEQHDSEGGENVDGEPNVETNDSHDSITDSSDCKGVQDSEFLRRGTTFRTMKI